MAKKLAKAQFGRSIGPKAAERKVRKGKGYFTHPESDNSSTTTVYNAYNKKGKEASNKNKEKRQSDITKSGSSMRESTYRPMEHKAESETKKSRPVRMNKMGGAIKTKKKK